MASVAAYGWRSAASVEEALYAEAYRFNFYQAARLLELIHRQAAPIGEGARPNREPVRFTSKVRHDFPAAAGLRHYRLGRPALCRAILGRVGGFKGNQRHSRRLHPQISNSSIRGADGVAG